MPLIVTVNTTTECLQTDCNILGDNKNITTQGLIIDEILEQNV